MIYRVFPGNLQKQISNKQINSRSFSGVFGLFECGRNFILVLLSNNHEKNVEILHVQKRLDFRVGSNWHILFSDFLG